VWCTFEKKWGARARTEQAKIPGVVEFARERLGFEPDAMQERVLKSPAKRGILNCTRQWGKSTVAAVMAVHQAASGPGSFVVVASPTDRQSAEFLRKAGEFVARLGIRPRGDGRNARSLLLPNGSRIVGLPGTEGTIRGFSAVALMVIDEAARVPDSLYKALRPMLAVSGGSLWLLSTPHGRQGFFYENWANGGAGWERAEVPATECSRIGKEFLEEERKQLGEAWFRQEYMCEFVDDGRHLFARDLVEGAMEDLDVLKV
jgi:hypothetical protein